MIAVDAPRWPAPLGGAALRARPRADALAGDCFHLAGLVGAGVALVDALDELASDARRRSHRTLWRGIGARVAGGAPLSIALADAPGAFDAELVALCRAGEADGSLHDALGAIEAALAARHELGRRARTALAYPAFAALVLGSTVAFLFGEVVPALDASGFAAGAAGDGAAPPWHARLLRAVAATVGVGGPPAALALGTLWAGWAAVRSASPAAALAGDRLALALSPAARLRATIESARFAGALARLHRAGEPLPDALGIALGGITRPALRGDLEAVRGRVAAGAGLGAALGDAPRVPRTLARFARAGESSGALPEALERAADALERDARTALERLERLVGPVLLSAVGAVLAWIVVSIVLPVYDAAIGAGLAS